MGFPEDGRSVSIHCKGILFDMDGILISSIEAAERAWCRWADLRGVDRERVLSVMHGCRAIETVAKCWPSCNAETELAVVERFEIEDTDGLKVLPGVPELLRKLPRQRWTVVTSATIGLMRVRFSAADIPVPQHPVTAELVTKGKPDPAPFLVGAKLLGFRPGECVVFEDSVSGVQAGRTAGCTVVGTTFSHSIDQLDAAHYVIEGLEGLSVEVVNDGLTLRMMSLK
jgi:mannitol-1-/sugar-/sorbitol-6-phosphatase